MGELEARDNGGSRAHDPEQQRLGRQPWEKRPSESLKAFTAFALYRDLGYYRTHQKVSDEIGVSMAVIKDWSRDHAWRDRIELYEVERDRRRLEAEMDEQQAARRTEAIAGRTMLRKGLQRLQGDTQNNVFHLDPNELDAADVSRFIAEGVRIQRLALGMPTDFSKGAFSMSLQEVGNLVRELVHGLMPLIPPERHQQAFTIVRTITQSQGN